MANDGMSVRQVSLSAKWLYIFSMQGVTLEATNKVMMKIPSGFFAFSRDELQSYFSNNYVTIHYFNSDSYFDAFCYDFTINSVNPLSDNITPAILNFSSQMSQQLNQLITMVNSINSGVNLIALNSGADDVDLGNVFAVYDSDKKAFCVYNISENLSNFHGVVSFSGVCSVQGVEFGTITNFYSESSSLITEGNINIQKSSLPFETRLYLNMSDSFNITIPLKFFNSSGVEITGLTFSSVYIPRCNMDAYFANQNAYAIISDLYDYCKFSVSFSNSSLVLSAVKSSFNNDISSFVVSSSVSNVINISVPSSIGISFSKVS